MARDKDRAQAGGDALAVAIAKHRMTTTALSRATDGAVSPTSIRAYMRGDTLPTRRNAFALAAALDDDGPRLLTAWGMSELIGGLPAEELEHALPTPDARTIRYEAPPESPRHVPIGTRLEGIVIARYDDRYLVRMPSGMSLWVEPVESIEWASWADTE